MANRCTPRAVAKIIPTTLKGLLAHEVFYLGKSEGVFLSEKNAVKMANAYEKWRSSGYVHTVTVVKNVP